MTQSEWKEIFGDNLVAILKERGMTQSELARESGLSTSRVSEYINGYAAPSIFAAINMAYVLGVDVGEFVDFEEPVTY
jgi:transcriptional regulator with XRE-family HTH domain